MTRLALLATLALAAYHILRLREERELAWDAAADAEGRALKAELELEKQGLAFSASIQREVELEGALLSARTQLDEQTQFWTDFCFELDGKLDQVVAAFEARS